MDRDKRAAVLLVLAGLLLVVGLVAGFVGHSVGANPEDPIGCGSAFNTDVDSKALGVAAYSGDVDAVRTIVERCARATGSAAPLAYGALGLGVLAGLLAVVVWPGRTAQVSA